MSKLSRKERERLRRREEIINAAEKVFARDGYENASMNEIAKNADFSKRTLYQYFENKKDLYLTVALRLYRSLLTYFENLSFNQTTGYERIKEVFVAYYQFYKENESIFRIIYDIGKVRQKTTNPKLNEFLKVDEVVFKNLQSLIISGQKDGSISKNLDAVLVARSLIFLLTGFFNQLTVTGGSYTSHIDVDMDEFSSYVLNLLHSCLK